MENIILVLIILVVCKAVLIGSEFNFITWIKYGKRYTKFYNSRPKFDPKVHE